MQVLDQWSENDKRKYGHVIQTHKHRLQESGLFTDDALAALLERHPASKIDVCTMCDDPQFPNKHCSVDFRGFSGEALVNAAKAGHIWINIREAMTLDPAYKPVMAAAFRDFKSNTQQDGYKNHIRGGILISSPSAKVPYHCDPTMTLLWHIRGRKRVFVYPNTESFLPDHAYEAILLGEHDQDIPYFSRFERDAKVFDLEDDTLVIWPHTSPHRVENQGYCVSVVMEFSSKDSALRNSVMYTNGLLRRKFGRAPTWATSSPFERIIKSSLGHILRRLNVHKNSIRNDYVRFKLNPAFEDYLEPIPSFIRDY